jgi:hypothetical protein
LFRIHARCKEAKLAGKDVSDMQATFYMAKEMGACLGRCQVLQRSVQKKQ